MVHAYGGGFRPAPGDPLTTRTFPLFFEVLRVLIDAGVTVVAEAAFQDRTWRQGLDPLIEIAKLRIVQCTVSDELALARVVRRRATEQSRAAHADLNELAGRDRDWTSASFERVSIAAPSIVVDTTDGYAPDLSKIVRFINLP